MDKHRQHARKASGAHEHVVEHQQFSLLNNQENDQSSSNLHEDAKMSLSSGGQFYKAKYDHSGLPSSRVKTPRLLEPTKGGNRPGQDDGNNTSKEFICKLPRVLTPLCFLVLPKTTAVTLKYNAAE